MEPVHYPAAVAPVAHPDRIKRPDPRRDSGKESAFARYLRRRRDDPDEHDAPEDADPGRDSTTVIEHPERAGRSDAADETTGQGPSKKLIDVRV